MLTDSHAHLEPASAAEVLARAREAGVTRVMTVSTTLGDPERVVALAASREDLRAAIGVHPHEASGYDGRHEAELRRLASQHDVVRAIGEIGLDYHYDHSPRDAQQDVFRRQIRLARDVGRPLVIHTREAEEDTARILEEERAGDLGGVLHCFTSSRWLAERCVEMGFAVSFSGIVTFPRSADLREVAAWVPADRLLVETDSPYLAPVPHRGKRNEPAFVRATAARLADLRGVDLESLARTTSANFTRVFGE